MTIKDNYRQEPTPSTTLHSSLIIYPLSFLFVLLFTTCDPGDPAVDALHRTADSLMAAGRPDSALQLLHTLDGDPSRRQLMRHKLLCAKAMNKAYVDFTVGGDLQSPDSVMRVVADYYDRHGTPNERMEAHYLLGCTYRDMGEAPRAIDCYLDAAACADTTAADCDFYTLASIYAQMAKLYHQQLLLTYEIYSHRLACHYNYLAGDTIYALYEQKMIAGTYILQNKKDSAELIIKDVIRHYRQCTATARSMWPTSPPSSALWRGSRPNRSPHLPPPTGGGFDYTPSHPLGPRGRLRSLSEQEPPPTEAG